MFIFYLLLLVVCIEAGTEILVKSLIFKPIRDEIKKINLFFKDLFECGYCTSVWVALVMVLISGVEVNFTPFSLVNVMLTTIIAHRLSNYLHNFNDKFLDKYYSLQHLHSEKNN